LCHNSMLLGFAAGRPKVSVTMAKAAVNEFENLLGGKPAPRSQSSAAPHPNRLARAALAVAAVLLVALGVLYVWSSEAWFGFNRTHAALVGEIINPALIPASAGRDIVSRPPLPALASIAGSRHLLAGAHA